MAAGQTVKLLLIAAGIFALAHAGGAAAPPAQPAYQVPPCHGAAAVPGYEKCSSS